MISSDIFGSFEDCVRRTVHVVGAGRAVCLGSSDLKMLEFSAVEVKLQVASSRHVVCEQKAWVTIFRARKCFLLA